jgi:hypothetical protein
MKIAYAKVVDGAQPRIRQLMRRLAQCGGLSLLSSALARGGGAPVVKRGLYLDLLVIGRPEPSRRPATQLATSNQPNL